MALNFKNSRNATLTKQNSNSIKIKEKIPFEHSYSIKIKKPKLSSYLDSLLGETLDFDRFCFFDTETTGLSGGAGTVIFLAGIGYFEEDSFIVKQYFIDNPGKEVLLIENLREIMRRKEIVVSYNGKSFDMPLLQSRAVMNRLDEVNFDSQIDLLHISRFIWKKSLKNCKLSTIETEILNIRRFGDIPGQLIPAAYREFLLRGNTEQIKKIIYHNREDIVSLARILSYLCEFTNSLENFDINVAIARKLFLSGYYEKSLEILRKSLDTRENISVEKKKQVFMLAASCLKKKKDFKGAAKLWEKIKTNESYFELVKYLEHKKKDYIKAKNIALILLKSNNSKKEIEAINYRLARLERKINLTSI